MRASIRDWEIDLRWPRKVPERVFVRFGLWDQSRPQSYNASTGIDERGLSVYPAILDAGIVTINLDDVWFHSDYIEELTGRLAFPVTGRVVGTGSDGEPLLKGARVLPYALNVNTLREFAE